MAAKRPRSFRRASRLLLVTAVALAHLGLFQLLSLNRIREPSAGAEPPLQPVAFIPLSRVKPRSAPPANLAGRRNKREQQAAAAPARPPSPAGAPGPGAGPPSSGGQGAGSRMLADPFAEREAL